MSQAYRYDLLNESEQGADEHVQMEALSTSAAPPAYHEVPSSSALPAYSVVLEEKRRAGEPMPEPVQVTLVRSTDQSLLARVGTDAHFFLSFMLSLVFSWIGFLVSFCIIPNVAGRCGGLAGLSMNIIASTALIVHRGYFTSWEGGKLHDVIVPKNMLPWLYVTLGMSSFFFLVAFVSFSRAKAALRRATESTV